MTSRSEPLNVEEGDLNALAEKAELETSRYGC